MSDGQSHEDEQPVKPTLSREEQQELVNNLELGEGLRNFGQALVNGQLSEIIPLDLVDRYIHSNYHSSPGYVSEGFESESGKFWQRKHVNVSLTSKPDEAEFLAITLSNETTAVPRGNKGVMMEVRYRVADNLDRKSLVFEFGIIYLQTVTSNLAYDAAIVFGSDGEVLDVLPPGDFRLNRSYGPLMRRAEQRLKDKDLTLKQIHYLDQAQGALEGVTLAHQRQEGQYGQLQKEVSNILGISSINDLIGAHIDIAKTMADNLNDAIEVKPAIEGEGTVSVPKIVFK